MKTASIFRTLKDFEWTDEEFIKSRQIFALCREYDEMPSAPVNIYEMHLGSWMKKEDGSYLSYRELADKLAEYVSDNFSDIEEISDDEINDLILSYYDAYLASQSK